MRKLILILASLLLFVSGCSEPAEPPDVSLDDLYIGNATWMPEAALRTYLGDPDLNYVEEAQPKFTEEIQSILNNDDIARPTWNDPATGEYTDEELGFTVTIPEGYIGSKASEKLTLTAVEISDGVVIEFLKELPSDMRPLIDAVWSALYGDLNGLEVAEEEQENGKIYTAVRQTDKIVWFVKTYSETVHSIAMYNGTPEELETILSICNTVTLK